MNAAKQLQQQEDLQQGLQKGLQQGREEGEHLKALAIARNMLAEGMSPKVIQKLTGLPENEVMDLVKKTKSFKITKGSFTCVTLFVFN